MTPASPSAACPLATAARRAAPEPRSLGLVDHLDRFLERHLAPGASSFVVAVSGGSDSTALLWGLTRLARRRTLELHPAHLDHGLDDGSRERVETVRDLCRGLGLTLLFERRPVRAARRRSESLEEAARRVRYRFLEDQRLRVGADYVMTAHQSDDQIETLLLRLLYGSGLAGMGGIAERRGRLLRPLLGLSRHQLSAWLESAGLEPVEDPSNTDLRLPRNRIRHRLIPALERGHPGLRHDLQALARALPPARERIERLLESRLAMRVRAGTVRLRRDRLAALPPSLMPLGLGRACQLAGLAYPPSRANRRELRRQLAAGGRVGCDLGGGWQWTEEGDDLVLRPARSAAAPEPFTYTLEVPGEAELSGLGLSVRLRPSRFERWMLRGSRNRAGLRLGLRRGDRVTIRSRRPGDRIRPFGSAHRRKLKDLLIDRRVPRRRRDRLPLLEVAGRIVWVPGVTIDEGCRLVPGCRVWLVEIVEP